MCKFAIIFQINTNKANRMEYYALQQQTSV
jgi:hypothetical protein